MDSRGEQDTRREGGRTSDRNRLRLRIAGRVQGVGFRWWSREQAHQLGVSGTVRNCQDGTVDLRAAGPPDALSSLRARLAEGPPGARVERIEELPPDDAALPETFEIVR